MPGPVGTELSRTFPERRLAETRHGKGKALLCGCRGDEYRRSYSVPLSAEWIRYPL